MAGGSSNQVIDQTVRLVHFRAGSLSAESLGTGNHRAMASSSPQARLSADAEEFLSRVATLSPAAWADIIERDREPPLAEAKKILAGLKLSVLPRRFRERFDAVYSQTAAARIRHLAETGALPSQHGWRMIHVLGSALQALCCRSQLLEAQFVKMYAPFEPYIPAASLGLSGRGPSDSSGAAGA